MSGLSSIWNCSAAWIAERWRLYEVSGRRRSGGPSPRLRAVTPFVERDAERASLATCTRRAAGHGGLAWSRWTGIGKSRLVADRAEAQAVLRCSTGHCVEMTVRAVPAIRREIGKP